MTYNYPDNGDKITVTFIGQDSNFDYWGKSEKFVLNKVFDHMTKTEGKKKILDYGCGGGRMFSEFEQYSCGITAIEPDTNRFNIAKEEAAKIKNIPINMINGDINSLGDEKFDVILCSHVINHIPQNKNMEMLTKFNKSLSNNGIIVLLSTSTDKENSFYVNADLDENGKYIEKEVTKAEFESGNVSGLPTQIFSSGSINKMCRDAGLTIISKHHFHYIDKENTTRTDLEREIKNKPIDAKDVLHIIKRNDVNSIC